MKNKMFFSKFDILEYAGSLSDKIDVNGSAGIGGFGLKLTDGRSFYEPNFNFWVERMAIELNLPFDKDMSRKYGSQFCIYFNEEPVIEVVPDEVVEEITEDVIDIVSKVNLEKAKSFKTKKALDEYANGFGFELDARKSLKNMVKELERLI